MSTGGAKRGRKPRGALTANSTAGTPRPVSQDPAPSTSVPTPMQWASQTMNLISTTSTGTTPNISSITSTFQSNMTATATTAATASAATTTVPSITSGSSYSAPLVSPAMHSLQTGSVASTPPIKTSSIALPGSSTTPIIPGTSTSTLTSLLANAGTSAITGAGITSLRPTAVEEDADGEDELLPAMADDDYSAQLSWQSQSKDNLKCVLFL
jgi:transcription initiation factor TFIID subunit 11